MNWPDSPGQRRPYPDSSGAMVGVTKIQRGNAGYWLAAVAQGEEDYYTKPGEAPGQWVGSLAGELGLAGEVDAEGYLAILEGRDPGSGAQLLCRPAPRTRPRADGSAKRVDPVLGYDVRFSAPKSVSLLYALGDEQTKAVISRAMERAIVAGLAHLEENACFVQRGAGGARIEPGSGFAAMAFTHRMSRAGDPALHVHVLVSNLTRARSDGKWLSLASPRGRSPLWPHSKSAGVIFQAELRAEIVRELGLGFGPVKNGYADLQAIPREAIDAFSQRSREIAAWLAEHGASGPAAAEIAAYRTREAKDYGVDADRRTEEWIARAGEFGLSPAGLREQIAAGRRREPRALAEADLDAAVAALSARSSHFDRRQLLWALADRLPEGASRETLEAGVQRLIASERVIVLARASGPLSHDELTTPQIAAIEQRFIAEALAGTGAGAGLVSEAELLAGLARHPHLGSDQRQLLERLLGGGERVLAICAWPGTGKTTALGAAREIWQAAGQEVIGCASARTASAELADAGVPATSIAALLAAIERWEPEGLGLPTGAVILVDEATMSSSPDLARLLEATIACDGKLVLVGDPAQIGAVGPGGLFAHLCEVAEPARLTEIRRQRHAPDRELIGLVHEGRGSEAIELLRARGQMIVGESLPATLSGLLSDWHRDFASCADVVMIARRNRDVRALNLAARAQLAREGALGSEEILIGELPFARGDVVLTRLNRGPVANRERWLVVDAGARTLELRRLGADQREVRLDHRYLDRRAADGAPALEYAYALTVFGAQGKSFDRAYPLLDAGGSLEEQLVAISRGREIANVYLVAPQELPDPESGPARPRSGDSLAELREAIARPGNHHAAIEVSLRRQVAALSPAEIAARRTDLARSAQGECAPQMRRALERKIEQATYWAGALGREREALEAMAAPPAAELRRASEGERRRLVQIESLKAELAALGEPAEPGHDRPADPALRLEAALIERRLDQLARTEVAFARLGESPLVHRHLGACPEGPVAALAWQRGAFALVRYRLAFDVRDPDRALGSEPRDPVQRAERERAERHLGRARDQLERGRELQTQAEREAELSLEI